MSVSEEQTTTTTTRPIGAINQCGFYLPQARTAVWHLLSSNYGTDAEADVIRNRLWQQCQPHLDAVWFCEQGPPCEFLREAVTERVKRFLEVCDDPTSLPTMLHPTWHQVLWDTGRIQKTMADEGTFRVHYPEMWERFYRPYLVEHGHKHSSMVIDRKFIRALLRSVAEEEEEEEEFPPWFVPKVMVADDLVCDAKVTGGMEAGTAAKFHSFFKAYAAEGGLTLRCQKDCRFLMQYLVHYPPGRDHPISRVIMQCTSVVYLVGLAHDVLTLGLTTKTAAPTTPGDDEKETFFVLEALDPKVKEFMDLPEGQQSYTLDRKEAVKIVGKVAFIRGEARAKALADVDPPTVEQLVARGAENKRRRAEAREKLPPPDKLPSEIKNYNREMKRNSNKASRKKRVKT